MASIGEARTGRNAARDIGGIFNRSNGVVLTGQEQSRAFNPIDVFQQIERASFPLGLNLAKPKIVANQGPGHLLQR